MTFSHLDLNYPGALMVKDVGHIKCPTISEIIELRELSGGERGGEDTYNLYLDVFIRTKAQFLEAISDSFEEKQLKEFDEVPLFLLYLMFRETRDLLVDAVDFFFSESAVIDPNTASILLIENYEDDGAKVVGAITDENFNDVKSLILQRNYITPPTNPNGKRRSKKMIAFDEQVEKGRKKSTKYQQEREAMQLGNLVSKVAAGASLSYSEVYGMTVFQLYDRFFEVNTSQQVNAALTRWCVWGQDKFDFSQWYKITSEK